MVGFDRKWFRGAVGVRATHPRVFACSLSMKITGILALLDDFAYISEVTFLRGRPQPWILVSIFSVCAAPCVSRTG